MRNPQPRLPLRAPKKKPSVKSKLRAYDAANREAAEIILANPEKHAGLGVLWAKLWMENHKDES